MNIYTEIIMNGLNIDEEEAQFIQEFISIWFDDFRWSSATKTLIIRTAKEAKAMIENSEYSELVKATKEEANA